MKTVTAFCCDNHLNPTTIWIESVTVDDYASIEDLQTAAREQCAKAWDYEIEAVHCLGLAEGSINIMFWEDL